LLAVISQLLLPPPSGKGRVAAFEIMICTPAIQHMIRDKKTHSIFSAIQTGQHSGMHTLDDSLVKLYKNGQLSREEMLRVAEQPAEILQKLGEKVPENMQNGGHAPTNGNHQPAAVAH